MIILQVIFALEQTLRVHERYRSKSRSMPVNDELISHYNCGDLKSVLFRKDTVRVGVHTSHTSTIPCQNHSIISVNLPRNQMVCVLRISVS